MSANAQPIYSKVGDVQFSAIVTAANTAKDGTGTVNNIFTADATNGGFVDFITFKPTGTNVATVARIFVNNGGVNTTATNNALIKEVSLPAITNTETAAQPDFVVSIRRALPPGYKLFFTLGTAVANGWIAAAFGGKY